MIYYAVTVIRTFFNLEFAMHKYIKFSLLCTAFLTATACFAQAPISVKPEKILIVYYSWSGNTRTMAQEIARQTNGTLFEIQPVNAYPTQYRQCSKVAREHITSGVKPQLVKLPELQKYDVIFLGSPNWWGTAAPPVKTVLAHPGLSGKTVIPFFTHGGGGLQNCEADVKKILKKSAVLPALTITGSKAKHSAREITIWLNKNLKITGN